MCFSLFLCPAKEIKTRFEDCKHFVYLFCSVSFREIAKKNYLKLCKVKKIVLYMGEAVKKRKNCVLGLLLLFHDWQQRPPLHHRDASSPLFFEAEPMAPSGRSPFRPSGACESVSSGPRSKASLLYHAAQHHPRSLWRERDEEGIINLLLVPLFVKKRSSSDRYWIGSRPINPTNTQRMEANML